MKTATSQENISALFVATDGPYFNLPGVDPWDEARDARKYAGPYPVVAHPPCQRWGKMWFGQPLTVKQTGVRKIKGDDGGCFAAALAAVRAYGGVLEHPWGSHAWPHFELNVPFREGGWIPADAHGGWTCCIEQGRYGHYARKPTLLYAFGCTLPKLDWGKGEPRIPQSAIDRMGLARAKRLGEMGCRGGGKDSAPRIHTPTPFRDLLLSMARSSVAQECAAPNHCDYCRKAPIAWYAHSEPLIVRGQVRTLTIKHATCAEHEDCANWAHHVALHKPATISRVAA